MLAVVSLHCTLAVYSMQVTCPSVAGLQDMLDKCSETAKDLSLEFDVEKCHCVAVGKRCSGISSMTLCGNSVEWCDAVKYLGVYLQGGRSLKFDINVRLYVCRQRMCFRCLGLL